jgi:chromosome segregation ATPase
MSTFNSLSYATQLVATGLPREQAEVHANALQNVYDEEHKQYATKADFVALSSAVKLQIHQLEIKTDRIETKTDQLEIKTDRIEAKMLQIEVKTNQIEIKTIQIEAKTNQIEAKTNQIEVKMTQIEKKIDQVEQKLSAELSGLKITIDECKNEFSHFRADVSELKTSHKYLRWIGAGVATMCLSVIGINISMFMFLAK